MPSLPEKDKANLEAALDAIRKIESFTEGIESGSRLFEEEMVFDATLMNFVVIGEVVDKISIETQSRHPSVPWPKVKSFRNIIAHNYFGVDADEVWQVIQKHLPL